MVDRDLRNILNKQSLCQDEIIEKADIKGTKLSLKNRSLGS